MKCHYCGKEVWLVRHLLDGDFCSPAHRKKYHERLRRSLEQLPQVTGPPAPVAGFLFEMPPADSHGTSGHRAIGLVANNFGLRTLRYSLQVTPVFGQAFFGPTEASAIAPPTARHRGVDVLDPVVNEPITRTLGRSLTFAGGSALAARNQWLALGRLESAGRPAEPIRPVAAALSSTVRRLYKPQLALGTVSPDQWTGESAKPAAPSIPGNLRNVPLASWTRTNLQPLLQAGHFVTGTAQDLPSAARAIATRNGSCLRVTRCAPPVFASPLLAGDAIARGNTAPSVLEAASIERPVFALIPELRLAGTAAGLVRQPKGIWKINPATPWNVVATQAEAIDRNPAAAVLPALTLAPVRPGLAAESDTRQVQARPLEMIAPAARGDQRTIGIPERPAVPPAIAARQTAPALPGAFAPHLFPTDVVPLQVMNVSPASASQVPLAGMLSAADPKVGESLAPCLDTCAGDIPVRRPQAAGPMATSTQALEPQVAAPRYSGEMLAPALCVSTAIPAGTVSGFGRISFAAIGPQSVGLTLKPQVSTPVPIAANRLAIPEPELAVSGVGINDRPGVLSLDVYVQRVKSAPFRECDWKNLRVRVTQPTAMPSLSPARFEQLVLQDWRRRYPARQVSITPAPILRGAKILPMARHLNALSRFRQNAPYFAKGLAASAFVGAVLWFSLSSQTVKQTVASDKHWLKDAIAKRATLVHDDNFRSGLNLWEGRSNWARSWSYSGDGFMRTGQLALYRPTLKMDNYRLEFFGQIESKSLGWVFRAKDEQNYYAMKLSVTEPGPRPLVSVVRYPVLNGKKGKRVQIPLPIMMHNNTPYRVALDVQGTRFRAYVEDQEVDSWNDDKLRAGGVGFFSETGEHARLYWVKVSKNTDWLGRLCGMLSGGNTSQDSADLWNPEPSGTMASLDPRTILDGAKNVDRRRGAPMLPLATVLLGGF